MNHSRYKNKIVPIQKSINKNNGTKYKIIVIGDGGIGKSALRIELVKDTDFD